MDSLLILKAVLIGLVEGITEFLPISSTGHMILVSHLIEFDGPVAQILQIVIQLGAILAICWLYRSTLIGVVVRAPRDADARRFIRNIVLAVLPAGLIGVACHDWIKNMLFNPMVIALAMVVGGIAILVIERMKPPAQHHQIEKFPLRLVIMIGLMQALALIPGVSRSGATIMGALTLGVDRKTAAEFSFFLAIPVMLGATVYEMLKAYDQLSSDGLVLIAVGFVTAFISAMLVVKWLVGFVSRHGFVPFAWYRIVVGLAILLMISLQSGA